MYPEFFYFLHFVCLERSFNSLEIWGGFIEITQGILDLNLLSFTLFQHNNQYLISSPQISLASIFLLGIIFPFITS